MDARQPGRSSRPSERLDATRSDPAVRLRASPERRDILQLVAESWIIRQEWRDLLFAHWRCDAGAIRSLLPAGLELDVWDRSAWIGVVPFLLTGFRLRGLPPIPFSAEFLELNVRTYVRTPGGKAGVWFFSLDAARWIPVIGARAAYHLPYFRSRMRRRCTRDEIEYESQRAWTGRAGFKATYRPIGQAFEAAPGTLEHFLIERYCLYAKHPLGGIVRADIEHAPWPLQPAAGDVDAAALALADGIVLPASAPLLHFAKYQDVKTWRPRRMRARDGRSG